MQIESVQPQSGHREKSARIVSGLFLNGFFGAKGGMIGDIAI
jgi:hypothetical protein